MWWIKQKHLFYVSCCGEIYCVQIALFELSIIKLIQTKIAYNSLKIIGSFSVLIRYTLIQWKLTNWENHPCCLCCLIDANFALKYLYRDKNSQINDSVYIESNFAINWLQVFYSLTYWRQNCEKKIVLRSFTLNIYSLCWYKIILHLIKNG